MLNVIPKVKNSKILRKITLLIKKYISLLSLLLLINYYLKKKLEEMFVKIKELKNICIKIMLS